MKIAQISQTALTQARRLKIKGQGMTEYLVILGLIAIAGIAVFSLFGTTLRNQVAGMAKEVAGESSTAEIGNANTSAGKASTTANKNYNMKTYTEGGNSGAQ